MFRTRFAPSPTGPLHLGHAYSALLGHDMAQAHGGQFLLRIEDTDSLRSRPNWEDLIYEDLAWLGISWESPILRQSERADAYKDALFKLNNLGLLYPCACSRADIENAASAPQEGVSAFGPDGRIYPGTCRNRQMTDAQSSDAIRLNMAKAAARLDAGLGYIELKTGTNQRNIISANQLIEPVGDVVLRRRQSGDIAYHLAVVVDDGAQGVSHVVRGEDLEEATKIHVLLQCLLGLNTPVYHHHRLIRDEAGKRLAKRNDAKAIRTFRGQGAQPKDIRALVGL